jgi:hypothetical protein
MENLSFFRRMMHLLNQSVVYLKKQILIFLLLLEIEKPENIALKNLKMEMQMSFFLTQILMELELIYKKQVILSCIMKCLQALKIKL